MPFSKPDSDGSAQTTMTKSAVAIAREPGLSSGKASSNAFLRVWSLMTRKRQHCRFFHEGARRAASSTWLIFSGSTGLSLYLRMLRRSLKT